MKTERKIFIAFLLNAFFSVFELIGGIFTGSVAIISDAVHDFGDALSIGLAYLLEKKSKRQPDNLYTYGYARYSVLGAVITNTILIFGSIFVIINAINRIINPVVIQYNEMIIFAIIGVCVNFLATYFTRDGETLNQKAVNLHMLEDVLGWGIVLLGAIVMKFTNFSIIDPLLSILVASFIMVNALKSYKEILDLFLEKTPSKFDVEKIKQALLNINEVDDVHHVHVWSLDGSNHYATMHIVSANSDIAFIKQNVKEKLKELGINHTTIEIEGLNEDCGEKVCLVNVNMSAHGHCHHHFHSYKGHDNCQCQVANSNKDANYANQNELPIFINEDVNCSCCKPESKWNSNFDRRSSKKDIWYDPMKSSKRVKTSEDSNDSGNE